MKFRPSSKRPKSPSGSTIQQSMPPSPRPARLADIQRLMAQAIMRPLTADEGMQRCGPMARPAQKSRSGSSSRTTGSLHSSACKFTTSSIGGGCSGVFSEDFRGLRAVLGERKFDRLAVAYLESRGSTSWNLRNVGQHLFTYLGEHPMATVRIPRSRSTWCAWNGRAWKHSMVPRLRPSIRRKSEAARRTDCVSSS